MKDKLSMWGVNGYSSNQISKKRHKTGFKNSKIKTIDLKVPRLIHNKTFSNNGYINFDINKKNKIKRPVLMKPKIKILSPAYRINNIRKMNWKQLKQKFPMMSPTADADFDGLINSRDCKPLDPSKDGVFSRFLGKVTGDKYGQTAAEYKAEKVAKKETQIQIKEITKARKEEKRQVKVRDKEERYIKEAARQVEEKGYATSAQVKGKVMEERLQELREKIRAKRKEFKPEKTLVGRLVKKIPVRTQKEIKAIKAKRAKGIVKAVERFAGVRGPAVGVRKTVKGQKLAGAGRPKGSYKYRDPRTGAPITAIQYHKLRKQLKRQAKTVETQTEVKQRFALAKRGLSPEEVSEAQTQIEEKMARLRAIKAMKRGEAVEGYTVTPEGEIIKTEQEQVPQDEQQIIQQQVQQIPTQVVQQQVQPQPQRVGYQGVPPGYRVQEDLMTGKKTLVPLPQQEAWTQ